MTFPQHITFSKVLCALLLELESKVKLRRRSASQRRRSSVAISWSRFEDPSDKRRDSTASWVQEGDDMPSTRVGRPDSWGPVGEFYYRESLCLSETDRSLFSHHECKSFLYIKMLYIFHIHQEWLTTNIAFSVSLFQQCTLLFIVKYYIL